MVGGVIHLEGMGWLGSVLAWSLYDADLPFTWHDIESPWVAWRASTGCVYPSGEPREAADHAEWLRWVDRDWWPAGAVEPVAYWFSHVAPPHGAKGLAGDVGWARVAALAAVQVDVAAVVRATRETFTAERRAGPPSRPHVLIRAHGYTERRLAYLWGFAADVSLEIDPAVVDFCPLRPTFVANAGRNQIAYAYAAPGRPGTWLAGSSRCYQTQPRELDTAKHLLRWSRQFTEAFSGKINVLSVGETRQGWRPRPANDDDGAVAVSRAPAGPVLTLPPMCGNGVRGAPTLVSRTLNALEAA